MTDSEKSTLLIVDDMPTNLRMLSTYLRQLDYKVLIAQDGQDALVRVAYNRPDLILLDVMMPKMDGFETCRRLKEDEKTREIPIIFMTALSDTVDKVKGFELGAVDYITKPVQHEEVLARITTHLALRHLQKTLEEKNRCLQQQSLELQKQNEELDAYAHTVAHNLKNPLNGVIGCTDTLTREIGSSATPGIMKFLQFLQQSGNKMRDTINALLLLASVRAQDAPMEDINMGEIVARVQHSLTPIMDLYQGEIFAPKTWPMARSHAPWIEEVWMNYISNGLQYGGKPPRLELGASPQDDGFVRFWVRDNGQGLTEEEQGKLFVPFTRLNKVHAAGGHGLGLSIVQRIVEKCGGQAGVESKPGHGSIFYFTLPAK
ncbi:MAG: response regulator [Gammaproteobacteria bacterium]|nr:response regulator [Gammaproteobacteria bacterium]